MNGSDDQSSFSQHHRHTGGTRAAPAPRWPLAVWGFEHAKSAPQKTRKDPRRELVWKNQWLKLIGRNNHLPEFNPKAHRPLLAPCLLLLLGETWQLGQDGLGLARSFKVQKTSFVRLVGL